MIDIKADFQGNEFNNVISRLLILNLEEDKKYELTIKPFKEKRSLQANRYSWKLTNMLSEKMLIAGCKISKDEMHAEMIFRYGQPELKDDQPVIITAFDYINVRDFHLYAKEIGQGKVNGKLFTHWLIYRGSHTYDKREMSLFIKGIVEECKELGIPTETPEQIANMISLMKEKK